MEAIDFIKKNFSLNKKFKHISLHDADTEVYLSLLSIEISDKFYDRYPVLQKFRKEIGNILLQNKKSKDKSSLSFKFSGNAKHISEEIMADTERWISTIKFNENWRDQTDDFGGETYNGWRLLDGKNSMIWLSSLVALRSRMYWQLASYKYLFFIRDMFAHIGREYLVTDPVDNAAPAPKKCRFYFKNHKILKDFDLTRWSKEISNRKSGSQGIQPPPELKLYILENFLKLKDEYYGLTKENKNTFYLYGREQDEYNRMSFKTIFFDYMTLWIASETTKLNRELEKEKQQFIRDVEKKLITHKDIKNASLRKLYDFLNLDLSSGKKRFEINFLEHLIALIDKNHKWSNEPNKVLEKKLSLLKFAWKNYFIFTFPLSNSENNSDMNNLAYQIFLDQVNDESVLDATRHRFDPMQVYYLHNKLELLHEEWRGLGTKESFDEFLLERCEELAIKFFIGGEQCFIYDHINLSPTSIARHLDKFHK